ncbi:MAG: RDD family protein, partial [Pseudanabaena sp. SU_2_4]|nr:RDD family protein [Pseudanabaena sp. SU_2_4]
FIACAFLGQLIEALLGLSNSGLGLSNFLAWPGCSIVFLSRGKNQGQSLGRWLVSIRVVDMMYGKSAGVFELAKREAAIYLCMALVLAGFNSGGLTNTISFFALIPIVIDGIIALADSEKMQTLHDKLSGTIVIVSRKGLQLDQKIAKLLGQASRSASKAYQSGRSGDRPNRGYGQGYGQDYGQGYAQATTTNLMTMTIMTIASEVAIARSMAMNMT